MESTEAKANAHEKLTESVSNPLAFASVIDSVTGLLKARYEFLHGFGRAGLTGIFSPLIVN